MGVADWGPAGRLEAGGASRPIAAWVADKQDATLAADALGPGSVERGVSDRLTDWLSHADYSGLSDTIAGSLAVKGGAKDGQWASTSGKNSRGDGGGGLFIWDATSTATPDGIFTVQASGVTTGRWLSLIQKGQYLDIRRAGIKMDAVRKTGTISGGNLSQLTISGGALTQADVGKPINVATAGASGRALVTTIATVVSATVCTLTAAATGAVTSVAVLYGTDNGAALQAALNMAGCKWLVPSGEFFCSSQVVPSTMTDVELRGASRFASRITGIGSGHLLVPTMTRAVIRDLYLTVEGGASTGYGSCIDVSSRITTASRIEDCQLETYSTANAAGGNGIKATYDSSGSVDGLIIRRCNFPHIQRMAIEFQSGKPTRTIKGIIVEDCTFSSVGENGQAGTSMCVSLAGFSRDCAVRFNRFNAGAIGLECVGSQGVQVFGNEFSGMPAGGAPLSFTGNDSSSFTAQSGSTSTVLNLSASHSTTTNAMVGKEVEITGGTGAGQFRYITANTTTTATVSPAFSVTPNDTSTYIVRYRNRDPEIIGNNIGVPNDDSTLSTANPIDGDVKFWYLEGGIVSGNRINLASTRHVVLRGLGTLVTGNQIKGTRQALIELEKAQRCNLVRNVVDHAGGTSEAISLYQSACQGNVVEDNDVTSTSGTLVAVNGGASNNVYRRNIKRSATTGLATVLYNDPEYADNSAAVSGGLVAGQQYRTATGEMRVVV